MTKRSRIFRWTAWLSFVVAFATVQGCLPSYYPDYDQTCAGPGELQVRWVFHASPVCPTDAGLINIKLTDDKGQSVTLPNDGQFNCTVRETVLGALPCGDYLLRVIAIDEDGTGSRTTYNSSKFPVRVLSGRINPVTVDLQIAP